MGKLQDKVVVITGGAQGMGELHAKKAIAEGAKVVITDINDELGQKTANSLGDDVLFIKHDVSKGADWNHVIQEVMNKWNRIDVLVNNAGITYNKTIDQISLTRINHQYFFNKWSCWWCNWLYRYKICGQRYDKSCS